MARVLMQEMVDDIRFDGLPVNWNAFDIGAFSRTKSLWDYQRKAVENAIMALWKYYIEKVLTSILDKPSV